MAKNLCTVHLNVFRLCVIRCHNIIHFTSGCIRTIMEEKKTGCNEFESSGRIGPENTNLGVMVQKILVRLVLKMAQPYFFTL